MEAILWLVLLILFYFAPSFTAYSKNHKNKEAILIVNIFLGFTGIGWLIALIWSYLK